MIPPLRLSLLHHAGSHSTPHCPSRPPGAQLNVDTSSQSFWQRGGWNNSAGLNNPWASGGLNAPFDRRYHLIINLAVGGTGGFFPDGQCGKPWSDTQPNAINSFYSAMDSQWGPTWPGLGSGTPFQIDSVRVWQDDASGDWEIRPML